MNTTLHNPAIDLSFKAFLFNNSRNRKTLYLAAIAIIIQFTIFKYLYPFASYIHGDSFSYLSAADTNQSINTYLIGYSKFLRLFSVFAKPDYMLVAFQYLFIHCSVLFLLFTIFYFYKPGKFTQMILLWFMILNPLFLHLANMISSDGLFLALSCVWFALLLWITCKPSNKIIAWHAVVLFIAFTVRYNAMIYPFISALAFWLSKLPFRKKITGALVSLFFCSLFIAFTMFQYKKKTGYWQYSPFSGWQFANNAMYAYRYVDSADRKPVSKKYEALDNMIRKFYDKTRNLTMNPTESQQASTFYMWSPSMPLMQYRDSIFKKANDTTASEFKKWASMGPLYRSYGIYIIKKYPLYFATYFIWPNSKKYYAPPVEFLEDYNTGKNFVTDQAMRWFGYKNKNVKVRMSNGKVWILDFYPILSGIINIVMLFGLLYYLLLKGWKFNDVFKKIILMGGILWVLNAGFTIFASSAALRFQSFPIILTTTFVLLLADWMAQLMKSMKSEQLQKSLKERFPQEAIG